MLTPRPISSSANAEDERVSSRLTVQSSVQRRRGTSACSHASLSISTDHSICAGGRAVLASGRPTDL